AVEIRAKPLEVCEVVWRELRLEALDYPKQRIHPRQIRGRLPFHHGCPQQHAGGCRIQSNRLVGVGQGLSCFATRAQVERLGVRLGAHDALPISPIPSWLPTAARWWMSNPIESLGRRGAGPVLLRHESTSRAPRRKIGSTRRSSDLSHSIMAAHSSTLVDVESNRIAW